MHKIQQTAQVLFREVKVQQELVNRYIQCIKRSQRFYQELGEKEVVISVTELYFLVSRENQLRLRRL